MRRTLFLAAVLFSLASCASGGRNETASSQATPAALPTQFPGVLQFSFVDRFHDGSINSNAPAATPTKRGALILPWPWGTGHIASLTVLAGYRYTYRNVAIASAGDVLAFAAAKPFSLGGADVRAFVDISDQGHVHRVFQASLTPATDSGPVWKGYSIPLKAYKSRRIQMTFGADSINGSAEAAWAAFAFPATYTPTRTK